MRNTCRISNEPLEKLFSLGDVYISDFIPPGTNPRLKKVSLELAISKKSGLVQLTDTAPFDEMYEEYWYKSGTNQTMTSELKGIAEKMISVLPPHTHDKDVWLDIGCNDGTLLGFVPDSIYRIGFDPAKNGYKEDAKEKVDQYVNNYFSVENYEQCFPSTMKVRYITSIAMFYDLENPHKFVADIDRILDDNGLWVIQMSYLPLMLKQLAFDNICHEHLEYYSLESLEYLLNGHGLEVMDCELNDINGGSFRVYVRKMIADKTKFATAPYRDVAEMRVQGVRNMEKTLDLKNPYMYKVWFQKVEALKKQTMDFINQEIKAGKKIGGYGASTKGNTLLQWFGLDNTKIIAIAERQERKVGLVTAGTNIPIISEEEMRKLNPDYMLVLPWHFITEFMQREKDYLDGGGKFIVPCPKFEIIESI